MCDGMQDYSKCPGENYSSKGCLSCHICFMFDMGTSVMRCNPLDYPVYSPLTPCQKNWKLY